jgi:hypothetical protein
VTFLWVGVPIELLIDIMTWGDLSFAGRVTLGSYQIIIQKKCRKILETFLAVVIKWQVYNSVFE